MGSPALIICENDAKFPIAFFGALLAGLIPVPLPTPRFADSREAYERRIGAVVRDCRPEIVLVSTSLAKLFKPAHAVATRVALLEEVLSAVAPEITPHFALKSDTAFIQYTSGSTGVPRGVELSHGAILHNVTAIGAAVGAGPNDVGVSWLPLFHDMGLIGALLFTLAWRMPFVLLQPETFLFRPAAWLWAISRYGGTLSPAPNFAYEHCVARIADSRIEGLNLKSWRVAFNGSEMVHAETIERFTERFGNYGFGGSVLPVYGLAEAALAVTFAHVGAPPHVDHVNRSVLEQHGRAEPTDAAASSRAVVGLGTPLMGQQVRVTGPTGEALSERRVGQVEVRGPCVMKGYCGNPTETERALTADGWLRTGDRGYLANSELFLVGRSKDVIKRRGSSVDAADLVAAVSSIDGVRAGGVGVFGVADSRLGSDRLVVAVEAELAGAADPTRLRHAVVDGISRRCGIRPDEVVLLKPGGLPRSTSGKVQHFECRRRYLLKRLRRLDTEATAGPFQ